MKFEKYSIAREIKNSLEELGLKRPTDIQYKAIPNILKKEDLLAIAQTGTGKTAAFVIPIVHLLHEVKKVSRRKAIRCVVLVPTRELALQITEVFVSIAKYTDVKAIALVGGVKQDPQIKQLMDGVDIVVSTPGRLFDLNYQGYAPFKDIEILVLDEADLMLDLGFYKDIEDLTKYIPRQRQTLFFSATINQKIKKLAYSLVTNAIRIQLSPKNPVSRNVSHFVTMVEMDDKRFFLERLVKENPDSKILAFVRTKVRAERVHKAMERVGITSLTLHSDKEQKDRLNILDTFKKGETKLLIATDISARGIDIPNVHFVVNYDLPEIDENYVHRVGRTGRGRQKGTAYSFCSKGELPLLKAIEEYTGEDITRLKLDKIAYNEVRDFTDVTNLSMDDIERMIEQESNITVGRKKKKKKKK